VSLTEHGAMLPAASVAGLYFGHRESRYFAVGRVGRDQVEDYARRKEVTVGEAERWLAQNLAYEPIGTALSMRTSAPKAFYVTAAVSASLRRPTSFAPPTRLVRIAILLVAMSASTILILQRQRGSLLPVVGVLTLMSAAFSQPRSEHALRL
jgi:cobalamin-dependent methionine synthase-like protein